MTKLKLLFLFFVLSELCFGQAPNWAWVLNAGGNSIDDGVDMAIDNNSDIYVVGNFSSSSITFGANSVTNYTTNYSNDFYIVKYNASGISLWAKSFGGKADDYVSGIAKDKLGNVYITGRFTSPSINFGSFTLTNPGSSQFYYFIAKLDGNGNVLWAYSASTFAEGLDISTDIHNNIYTTGHFMGSKIAFGTDTLSNSVLGYSDVFTVKYNSNGVVQWAKSMGGNKNDVPGGISSDLNGEIYLTGYFNSTQIAFGSDILNNLGSNNSDVFLVKYDSLGNELWARSGNGSNYDNGNRVTTDSANNIYISGSFQSTTIAFSSYTLTNTMTNSSTDGFIAKYNTSGNCVWARKMSGSSDEQGIGLSVDLNNNLLVTGLFGSANFAIGSYTLAATLSYDIFIAQLDSSGNGQWAIKASGTGYDAGTNLLVDPYNNIYVTGRIGDTVSCGPFTTSNNGGFDMFLGKLGNNVNIKESPNAQDHLIVSPNPFFDKITVSKTSKSAVEFLILDQLGRVVFHNTLKNKNSELNLGDCDSGIYYLKTITDNKTYKIIKGL